jgi:hypothetical protein
MALGALLRVSLLVPLGATPALLFAASGFRLRLGFSLLRLRLSPLPLRLPALPSAAALLFATSSTLCFATSGALLFAATAAVRPFVAPTPLAEQGIPAEGGCLPASVGAFGALLGMAAPARLPMGFRVGAGDRGAGQGKRAADRDRAALSASVSRAARHVPARLRVPRRARERS